ncbi:MAG: efflux RND transporter periplasmic adaptor subunit, partial [Deltaproteobacteria bacterium]
RQALHEPVTTSGRITFDDLEVSHVYTPVTGRVSKVNVDLGARVSKGDLLATLESPDLGQISADFDKARADLVAAEHDYIRRKSLYESHAIAHRDYESAQNAYGRAKAEYDRAGSKAKLLHGPGDRSGAVSQTYELRASIDGEIIARNLNPGAGVQGQYSGASPELFTIGSLDSVWVLSDLFEMDMQRVSPGQSVEVRVVAYPGRVFAGTIDWVSPSLDPNSRTAKARCSVANPGGELKPEMDATVVMAGAAQQMIAVPRRSIFRLGKKTVVFVQSAPDDAALWHFVRREVVVDEEVAGDNVPVRSGLEEGEHVVVSGGYLLTELT